MNETEELESNVMAALARVIDPELGFNIVDLGLVYRVDIDAGNVQVLMTTTTRGCPATNYLRSGANRAVESTLGVASVNVELTYDPPWTPAMMTPKALEHLGIGSR